MSWWPSSWFPTLPSLDFVLPSSIQRRFISFALRRSLGHFLKPGQLNIQQIDSQIGSGYVQVRDLELDNDAVNHVFSGLPIQLHDGSLGKVTVRIPWPNPLTSTVGLSLESLHLTFYLNPTLSNTPLNPIDLAESVASVAETFMHEELTPREEAALRESLYPDLTASTHSLDDNLPGGLDPFITDEEMAHPESEPAGVSIFATLIERLLARFEFDASDIKITLVHPQHASFTLAVLEIHYGAEGPSVTSSVPTSSMKAERTSGEVRTITISGVNLTTRCLRPPRPQSPSSPAPSSYAPSPSHYSPSSPVPTSPSNHSPMPSSPYSDSSDLDEETQLLMSQSIIALPPRVASPASTIASSMYQSAVSTASTIASTKDCSPWPEPANRDPTSRSRDHPSKASPSKVPSDDGFQHQPQLAIRTNEIRDDTLISSRAEPITIRLTTPVLLHASNQSPALSQSPRFSQHSPPKASNPNAEQSNITNEKIRLDASVGIIACSLRARHIRSILDVVHSWNSHSPDYSAPHPSVSRQTSGSNLRPAWLDELEANLHVRGVVILLLPGLKVPPFGYDDGLTEFYARPLVPPRLCHGFVRLHLDNLSTCISMSSPLSHGLHGASAQRIPGVETFQAMTTELSFSLSEMSAFAFMAPDQPATGSQRVSTPTYAIPLMITDPHLPVQYHPQHISPDLNVADITFSLPVFEVINWTDPARRSTTAKLSLWRSKPPPHLHPHSLPRSHAQHTTGRSPTSASVHTSPQGTISPLSPSVSPSSARPFSFGSPSSPGMAGLANASGWPSRSTEIMQRSHSPAMAVKVSLPRPLSSRILSRENNRVQVEVDFAPLHVFVDLGLVLTSGDRYGISETLVFLEEIVFPEENARSFGGESKLPVNNRSDAGDELEENAEDVETPPSTPRASNIFFLREQEREQERERRRLERLVLDDLNLGFDYRNEGTGSKLGTTTSPVHSRRKRGAKGMKDNSSLITLRFPMIRVQVRVPPPPSCTPRSGVIVFDVHDLRLSLGGLSHDNRPTSTRFADGEPFTHTDDMTGKPLLAASWRRLVVGCSLVGEDKASSILSLGSISTDAIDRLGGQFGTSPVGPQTWPSISLIRSPASDRSGPAGLITTAVAVDIPSVHVELSKPNLDVIQLWADDLAQLMEAVSSGSSRWESDTERGDSRDPSLIGSRFFAMTRAGSQASGSEGGTIASANPQNARSETAIKLTVSNAVVRLLLPRDAEGTIRPFDIAASDVDILVELQPEGKDETVLTLGIMDISVKETAKSGSSTTFLSLTSPHSLAATRSALKLRLTSLTVPETTSKESRIRLTLSGLTYNFHPYFDWAADLGRFAQAPPGAFESVVPSERTSVSIKLVDTSFRLLAPTFPGTLIPYVGELNFSVLIVGSSPETSFQLHVPALSLFLVDDLAAVSHGSADGTVQVASHSPGALFWEGAGYSVLAELTDVDVRLVRRKEPPHTRVTIGHGDLHLHLCADTLTALTGFINDFTSMFSSPSEVTSTVPKKRQEPSILSKDSASRSLLASLDEHAFRQLPEVGAAPDMISDDLPSNMDYLDESFGAAAGLRELTDDDLDDFDADAHEPSAVASADEHGLITRYGGETIKMLHPEGMHIVQNYFDTMKPDGAEGTFSSEETTIAVRVHDCNATLFLYDGYDWARTRRIIEEERKEMRRKLAKIRQLVASGQTPDPSVEETNTLLFNSVYIGLEHNIDELEPGALIAAIDEELNEDFETASQSSWQSLKQQTSTSPVSIRAPQVRPRRKGMVRSRGASIELQFLGLNAEVDHYEPGAALVSRILITITHIEILDHIKTSTWSRFLTALREDSRGNVRETDSNMVKVELRSIHPIPDHPSVEARLRAKILPLRLHVDQDALDFLKKFFSFKDPDSLPAPQSEEIYFQQAEMFPIGIKLDYKPRRVDYRALRDGRTIELMNFFHFDGAEMTLRHITLTGVTGWSRLFDLLNDLWTPDVKATQLVDVISGVAPIRSVVNVGSGFADLVLLPIAQYKKDGRVVRGLQKGATAFVKSTATEAIKLGARLATGTQVILEQAENVLGGQHLDTITAEAVQTSPLPGELGEQFTEGDLISRYADQPINVKEGIHTAFRSLKRNFGSAAQTILAVPMEVYERSGNEGPVRAVVRAVPIAVLKPMIGASEAVSKTLLGLHNSLDPKVHLENEAKYKQR
ncbi:Autophagy-related protein [Sparassis crispa]|uniref:Autophagy-related protein 2 n=1 Tax=Sparassis crispa TaxID=139825 RepID=A0A401GJ23_9APHY|nr:Autophagy-related protein [Sparassis crispa]GBE82158.1 Autophagy-related protein [Sparassis crispa]